MPRRRAASPTRSSRSTRRSSGPGRLDPATFRATYTQSIRIVPTRYLAWHGRGEAHAPVAVAPQPTVAARSPSASRRDSSASSARACAAPERRAVATPA